MTCAHPAFPLKIDFLMTIYYLIAGFFCLYANQNSQASALNADRPGMLPAAGFRELPDSSGEETTFC